MGGRRKKSFALIILVIIAITLVDCSTEYYGEKIYLRPKTWYCFKQPMPIYI